MRTRISQEEAIDFVRTLPTEITEQEFKMFNNKSLHLRLTSNGLKFTFTEEQLEGSYHIEGFKLSFFYKGQDEKRRVPLKMGGMMLWTTVYQYMAHIQPESRGNQELPFDVDTLRYLGTTDEGEGTIGISSSMVLPYRLTHEFLTEKQEDVLYIEDVYPNRETKTTVVYNTKVWGINYLEEDKLRRLASWGQSMESELSKRLKEERELYELMFQGD